MKKIGLTLLIVLGFILNNQAQNTNFNQDFESLEAGKNITKLKKKKFQSWGKATWTVTEQSEKGHKGSNKFASSDKTPNSTLVLYKNLEVGATYRFSVAVKITNAKGNAKKTNYTIKAGSGKKGNIYIYGINKVKVPDENQWKSHKLEFTVIEGREQVML